MTPRIVLFACVALVAGLLGGVPHAAAAGPQGAFCHISGKAVFDTGLTTTARSISYTFAGKLDNCASSSKYKKALITAKGSGSLACQGGTSKGVATIYWTSTVTSTVKFATDSAAALVDVSGKVTSGYGKGDSAHGDLLFQADASKCMSGGVKTARFNGTTEYGDAGSGAAILRV
jgi:hypothetical protein